MNISTLQKGLVAHWKLSESSFNPSTKRFSNSTPYPDNHGTGHGTKLGSATPGFLADRMGQAGLACPFGGIDDYIDCGNDASLDLTKAMTLSAWVKINNFPSTGNYYDIVGKTTSHGTWAYMLYISHENRVRPHIYTTNGIISLNSVIIETDKWYHIVHTYDKQNLRLYIDGVEDINSPVAETGDILTVVGNLTIGYDTRTVIHMNGSIAEIRIYNRALSPAEALLLSQIYRPGVLI